MAGDPSPKTRHLKVRFIPPGGSTSADADAHGPKAPAPPSSAAPPPPAVEPASSGMADEPPPKTRQLKVRFIPPRGSTSGDADAHGPETLAPPSSAAPPPPAVAPASSAPRQPDPADNRSRRSRPGSAPPSSLRPPPSGKVFSPTPPSSSTSSRRKSERGVAKILDPPPSRALMSPEASTAIPTSNSRSLRRTPARAARLDAASQHCHKDEAPTKVQDIFSGTNCKGKLPLNAGAEIQKKVQSSYLSLSRPLSSHTLPKIFGDVSWKGACGKSFEGEKKISTVALITDEDMLLHESADTLHDENPARLISIMSNLRKGKLINRCDLFKPDEIGVKYMLDVHSSRHVKDVVSIATKDQDQRDNLALKHCSKGDMYYSQGSTRAALLAAGGSVKACTLAVEGMYKYAFALVRPPGHHAGLHGPSGFCLLNNVAVGAMHLLNKYQMKRIVILDWDIHHGNGTQKIFYKDNRVLVISVHRYGDRFYPVSSEGNTEHIGEGGGRGFNANICFTHSGIRDVDYITVWEHLVMPVISEFDPEIVLISAGFDATEGDALGQCKVTPNGFATLLQMLMKFDRLVMVLEGGYNLDALSESVSACIEVLLGEKSCIPLDRTILPYSTTWEAIIETRKVLKPFWDACKPDIPEAIRSKSIRYAAQETTDQDFA